MSFCGAVRVPYSARATISVDLAEVVETILTQPYYGSVRRRVGLFAEEEEKEE